MHRAKPTRCISILAILLPLTIALGLFVGTVNISIVDVINTVFFPSELSDNTLKKYYAIIVSIRLPRVLLAAAVGALLAMSGAVMQGFFRNPLADPSLIGVTAGASMGGSIVIFLLSITSFSSFINIKLVDVSLSCIAVGAIIGGLVAVYWVYCLANNQCCVSVETMLLAGIGITALAASVTSFLEFMASNELLRRISLWHMGDVESANGMSVSIALIMVMFMGLILPSYAQGLNALLLGESEARHLGIDVETMKRHLIILVAASIGVTVALAGTITFVGLMVPHMVRLFMGPDYRFLLPASALGGAVLLVLADIFARILLAPTELPIGLVTALIGAPFFICLLTRRGVYGLS